MGKNAAPRRAYVYAEGRLPAPNVSGPSLVLCSEVQALLDLGFDVEMIVLRTSGVHPAKPDPYFSELRWAFVDAIGKKPPLHARPAYWTGWPRGLAWRQLYPARDVILREAKARIRRDPDALHFFNYLATANVIPTLPKSAAIWICLDIESDFVARSQILDQRVKERRPYSWEKRYLVRLCCAEREVARRSRLVWCVSESEAGRIREEWNVPHAACLPMSVALGDELLVSGSWMAGGTLRLLHLGLVSHLPTYLSLEVILTKVFPLLDPATLSRLQLEVVGKFNPDGLRGKALLEMARPYPQVKFSGFLEDIRTAYCRNDLQLVAATEATGLRTRIIESWAFGLPVLSTTVGAGGVEGLHPGRNILIANEPGEFARKLTELVQHPEWLAEISTAGRETYDARYSRGRVAAGLRELLNKHLGMDLSAAPSARREPLKGYQ